MRHFRLHLLALAALCASLVVATGASGSGNVPASVKGQRPITGTVSVISEATGPEQRNFEAVLDGFRRQYPRVRVQYTSAGRQLPTILATAVQGGNPPHVALLPQPGLMRDFIRRRALRPINFVRPVVRRNWSRGWVELGTSGRNLYAVYFKGANKSTLFYNVRLFRRAGVRPPATFSAFLRAARTLRASGTRAYSIGGADGWTLTDIFENIYLRQAGPTLYDRLSRHRIRWTHPSVRTALRTMARIVGDTNNIAGGRSGALQTGFADSVTQAFRDNPAAAIAMTPIDAVAGIITGTTEARPGTGFNFFSFPTINRRFRGAVVGGGDAVVMFRDTPAARALIRYFTTPRAAEIWARLGGFSSPNRRVRPSAYRNAITRRAATQLARARTFRFDLSDLQPGSFGATVGQGLFKLFQDFVENPRNVNGISAQMERAAAAAYRGG